MVRGACVRPSLGRAVENQLVRILCKKKLKSKGPLILINFNSFQIPELISEFSVVFGIRFARIISRMWAFEAAFQGREIPTNESFCDDL